MRQDIAYWLNVEVAQATPPRYAAFNCAVERSTIAKRDSSGLLPQDCLVRDHLRPEDVLVCSAGGNDIIMKPSLSSLTSLFRLTYTTPMERLQLPGGGGVVQLEHFRRLFHDKYQHYLEMLVATTRPRLVIPCMVYNPCSRGLGWPMLPLSFMGYYWNPQRLQRLNDIIFEEAVRHIHLPGTRVHPMQLSKVLDPSDTSNYVNIIEPSSQGGQKLAKAIWEVIDHYDKIDGMK